MAEKYQQHEAQGYPLAPATIMPRSDAESATNYRSESHTKKTKRIKRLACTAIVALIVAAIALAIVLIFVRVRTPRMRLNDVRVVVNGNSTINFSARIYIRNRNFGRYKFDDTLGTIRTTPGDNVVGRFIIPDSRIRARRTRRIYVVADLNSFDTSSGSLVVRVDASVRGEVEIFRVFDRRKTAHLRCSVTINLASNVVQDVRCD